MLNAKLQGNTGRSMAVIFGQSTMSALMAAELPRALQLAIEKAPAFPPGPIHHHTVL